MTRFTRSFAAVGVVACSLAVSAVPGRAGELPVAFRVLTPIDGSGIPPALAALASGDLLTSGAAFRIELEARSEGKLGVVFESAQGESIPLLKPRKVGAGARLMLPADKTWYRLDKFTGTERLRLVHAGRDGRIAESHVIRHVSSDFFDLGTAAFEEVSIGAAARTREDDATTVLARAVAELPRSMRPIRDALADLAAKRPEARHQPTDPDLANAVAQGVVMVVSDTGAGAGAVISTDGQILTNGSIVAGAKTVGVVFKPHEGEAVKPTTAVIAVVERIDAKHDLALIRAVSLPRRFTVLPLAEGGRIAAGDPIHVVGHPGGFGWTRASGTVEAVRPGQKWPGKSDAVHEATVIEARTPVDPGRGGIFFDSQGRIVGIGSVERDSTGTSGAVIVGDIRRFIESRQAAGALAGEERGACTPRRRRDDADRDGKIDHIRVDLTCDGRVDLMIVDADNDGRPDYAVADRDGDAKPDVKLVSTGRNGLFDIWLFDSDRDGRADLVGYDDDLDGKIDRYKRA